MLSEESERRRLAVELHDQIGQVLAATKIKLGSLRKQISTAGLDEQCGEAIALCDQAIKFTRSLTSELSPPILYELGFEAALEWLARQHRERYGISVEMIDDRQPKPLSDDVRVLLFRAVRELLVNVSKHAQADSITISVAREASDIRVVVEDDGIGFDISKAKVGEGFGIFNIRERLELLGGSVDMKSEPGRGTQVILKTSLRPEAESDGGRE